MAQPDQQMPPALEKALRDYLSSRKALIADPSGVTRSAIAQCLTGLGVKASNLSLIDSYELAESEIAARNPSIVVCDYDLGKKCGLDLLQQQRRTQPNNRDTLFVLVTGNSSQSAVARAAEEDIDTYILKPFTAASLKASFVKAALLKINPPKYLQQIEKGKAALANGNYDEAMRLFGEARTLDVAPALACFYQGQTRLMTQLLEGAMSDYSEGLSHNNIHYKCLVGLYELHMQRNDPTRAYEVIRKISKYFPANPERISAVLRLAIVTKNYDDIDEYYQTFIQIDGRSEEMIKYICAALVVCGKYFLKAQQTDRALDFFKKAATTAAGRTRILKEIVINLSEHGLADKAQEFMKRFPMDSRTSPDFAAADFAIVNFTVPPRNVVDRGRDLIKMGSHHPYIYQTLIQRSLEVGLHDLAQEFAQKASTHWPDQKDAFTAMTVKK